MGFSVVVLVFIAAVLSMLVSNTHCAPTKNFQWQNHFVRLYNLKSSRYLRINDSGIDANGDVNDRCANIILEMTANYNDSAFRIRSDCTRKYLCVHKNASKLVLEEDSTNSTRCQFTESPEQGYKVYQSVKTGAFIGFNWRGRAKEPMIKNRKRQNVHFY